MNNTMTLDRTGQTNNQATGGLAGIEGQRAVQEVQAAVFLAKQFPRDQKQALGRIQQACTRKELAEVAVYSYPRGDQIVKGPSIRLAEAIAQNWGNMQFGLRELSQQGGFSEIEAYAWDLETNNRASKVFKVAHKRHTKKGAYDLTDPRDIYEMVANQGSRRLRACILALIPGDVVDVAVEQSEKTLRQSLGAIKDLITKITDAYAKFGITKQDIENSLGHNIEAMTSQEYLSLRGKYQAIIDGMAKPEDLFPKPQQGPATPKTPDEHRQAARDQILSQAEENDFPDPGEGGEHGPELF